MTIGKNHMGLLMQVVEIEGHARPVCCVTITYWNQGDKHARETLCEYVELDMSEGLSYDVIEQYAVAAGRAVARAIETEFYDRVEKGTNVITDDFQKRM